MAETLIEDFSSVADWTSFVGTLTSSSGQGAGTAATDNFAYLTGGSYGPDIHLGITIAADPGTGNGVLLAARLITPAFNGYTISLVKNAGTDTILLRRLDSGAPTSLGSWSQEINVGDRIGISCVGSTITAYYDNGGGWTVIGSATDATYSAAGTIGLDIVNTSARVDDLVSVDLVTNITVTDVAAPTLGHASTDEVPFTPVGDRDYPYVNIRWSTKTLRSKVYGSDVEVYRYYGGFGYTFQDDVNAPATAQSTTDGVSTAGGSVDITVTETAALNWASPAVDAVSLGYGATDTATLAEGFGTTEAVSLGNTQSDTAAQNIGLPTTDAPSVGSTLAETANLAWAQATQDTGGAGVNITDTASLSAGWSAFDSLSVGSTLTDVAAPNTAHSTSDALSLGVGALDSLGIALGLTTTDAGGASTTLTDTAAQNLGVATVEAVSLGSTGSDLTGLAQGHSTQDAASTGFTAPDLASLAVALPTVDAVSVGATVSFNDTASANFGLVTQDSLSLGSSPQDTAAPAIGYDSRDNLSLGITSPDSPSLAWTLFSVSAALIGTTLLDVAAPGQTHLTTETVSLGAGAEDTAVLAVGWPTGQSTSLGSTLSEECIPAIGWPTRDSLILTGPIEPGTVSLALLDVVSYPTQMSQVAHFSEYGEISYTMSREDVEHTSVFSPVEYGTTETP